MASGIRARAMRVILGYGKDFEVGTHIMSIGS
jgi:hypothetical protein